SLSDEKASLLYILDILGKNLLDLEHHPLRKTREQIDEFSKALIQIQEPQELDKLLFKIRQFYTTHRVEEYGFVQKTLEEFKTIIWDFADQLGEDLTQEKVEESNLKNQLDELREAVESNAIENLKKKSRTFIDTYIQYQAKKNDRRSKRMGTMTKTLSTMKKQLSQAQKDLKVDHLSQAYNRRSFDEQLRKYQQLYNLSKGSVSLLICDIDFFKKINDSYGHDIGDHVIKECVRFLKESFSRDQDFVARIGGEEFAVILPDYDSESARLKVEQCLQRVSKEKLIHGKLEIQFTLSAGVAQLEADESFDQWLKRADLALYQSKNSGRNRCTVSEKKHLKPAA
ncbi:MAG: GGDEF domain-containing protein, partial [Bdellovibrionales bacterium]